LSVSFAAIPKGEALQYNRLAGAQACDPWDDSPAVRAWERDSLSSVTLAYFQTPAWTRTAGAYDKAIGRVPLLLTCHEPGGADFFIPFSIGRESGLTVARILGEQLAEYAQIVGRQVTPERLRTSFSLLRRRHRVDLVALRRVPTGTSLDIALGRIGATSESPQVAPWIPLGPQGPLPNANGGLPAGYRDGRRRRKRLQQEEGCTFEVLGAGPSAKMLMSLALSWKKDWVRDRGLVSRVGTDALDQTICSLMNTAGLGSALGVLRIGAEPVAVASGFHYRDRFYSFVRAYRPDCAAQSVGRIVVTEMVDWCAAQGVTMYDYGPPADPFKLEWTDHVMPVANRLVPLSLLGRLHGQIFEGKVKPAARAVVASLPAPVRSGLLRLTRYTH
jgi:CelD/BcsL family acetyltransferase involved in cellulose biosynthesis